MTPDLEVIYKPSHESFRAWAHGFPHTVAKWHFHPEYELHFNPTDALSQSQKTFAKHQLRLFKSWHASWKTAS